MFRKLNVFTIEQIGLIHRNFDKLSKWVYLRLKKPYIYIDTEGYIIHSVHVIFKKPDIYIDTEGYILHTT